MWSGILQFLHTSGRQVGACTGECAHGCARLHGAAPRLRATTDGPGARCAELDVWTDELVKVIELAGNARARKVWESDGTDSWVGRVQHLSGEVGRDSFENAGGAELRSAWIKAKYSDCAFLAKREKRRFSDASVLTLGSVVTGLCVAGKWDELLECLEGAAGGNKARDGVFAEHAVDLELSAPWTVLYLTTV